MTCTLPENMIDACVNQMSVAFFLIHNMKYLLVAYTFLLSGPHLLWPKSRYPLIA